ncbi:MAG: bifunctional hydroxymethylpyrimidine kinase/phosphomethylpyrimidine kinase [Candidatus Omnitrophica bacterium]|nr:bifunctional hydroxymethylpyrimidine kinase/phosphomethylpyrimidine kinase [Candidatus Omnitrophota bacterium]
MSLSIIGSVALDTVETPYGKKKDILGGSAIYSSVSASFFTAVNLISVVGNDFPEKYTRMLDKKGIDIRGLEVKKGKTFRWEARYRDLNCAETLNTHLNVFEGFRPKIPPHITPKGDLLLANIDPELQECIFKRIRPKGLVSCDTMNLWITQKKKVLEKLLKKVDLFLLNDAEACQLSGENNLFEAARYIADKGAKMIVIKKGEHGVLFFSPDLKFILPAYLLEKVKDPTGAGDTFAGGMVGYLAEQKKINDRILREAMVYGTILASFAVENFGGESLAKVDSKAITKRRGDFEKLTRFYK